ncbi:E3 ubiquitin-protein ligase MIEL1-like [Mangifera indica]|uniref:E3 ubiquitin-protein ligase MIEL1-like n=1 Tax=Mangifera indica TaxID=29780 RepID=UPI001CFC29BB|nr:E3 ubiquitin-protein ligase MIEL1-like [Mangifera indica]
MEKIASYFCSFCLFIFICRCEHYQRRCKIRSPCCDKIFLCRHCHNEAVNSLCNPKDHHELVRENFKQVICSRCNTQQEVAQILCSLLGQMGEYFCNICEFHGDDISKGQFHYDDCGIGRSLSLSNVYCESTGSRYSISAHNDRVCIENSMKNYCPVCYEVPLPILSKTVLNKS